MLVGHRVTMVCGSSDRANTGLDQPFERGVRKGAVDGIDIVEFDLSYSNHDGLLKRSRTFLRYAFKSVGVALTGKYDLVFATSTPLTAGIPAIFARWLRRKPFVFEIRDLWPELPREMGVITNPLVLRAMSMLEWASYHSANRCIALSPGIAEGISRRGIPRSRITIIPNGCDIEIFRAPALRWRPETIPPDNLLAIFAGAHGTANGLDAVVDAAIILQARGRMDITLLLVGDGKMKPKLQERAEKASLTNLLFHAPVNKARLVGLMADADIGLQVLSNIPAFQYGTSPNKFFDYIAAGLPVLNNYPGWLAEMIESEDCGFVVPPDDPEAFADALERAADDPPALRAKGERAAKLASRSFDRTKLVNQWIDWVTKEERP